MKEAILQNWDSGSGLRGKSASLFGDLGFKPSIAVSKNLLRMSIQPNNILKEVADDRNPNVTLLYNYFILMGKKFNLNFVYQRQI